MIHAYNILYCIFKLVTFIFRIHLYIVMIYTVHVCVYILRRQQVKIEKFKDLRIFISKTAGLVGCS